MAIRPTVPPRPSPGPRPGGGPGSGGGNLRPGTQNRPAPAKNRPGAYGPTPPAPPPTTPFQPGAPPLPPLAPIVAAVGGLLLLGKFLWDFINQRPPQEVGQFGAGEGQVFGPTLGDIQISWVLNQGRADFVSCADGSPSGVSFPASSNAGVTGGLGNGISGGSGSGTRVFGPPGGPTSEGTNVVVNLLRPGAPPGVVFLANVGRVSAGDGIFGLCGSQSQSVSITGVTYNGVVQSPPVSRPDFAPGTAPTVPEIGDAPGVAPVPIPLLPPAPNRRPQVPPVGVPIPRPAGAPGGAPAVAPRPGTTPLPAGAPAAQPNTPPALPQAQPITAGGVRPQLPPAPRPTPVGSTFLQGGVELPNNGPPPTPEGMATELGKLEKKLEIALAPEGPLSLLQQINRAIDQIENIRFLLDALFPPEPYTFPPGQYQLSPICDRDAEGDLLPPRLAPWSGGEGEFTELRQRLDALAVLLQHHKDLKQPTCGPRGNGPASNVTVHFESD